MSQPILSVRNLTTEIEVAGKVYPVVDHLSFDLHMGETLALVGESGCGKSMAAFSLMRILPTPPCLKSTGEVLYRGENLLSLREKQMRKLRGGDIAMVFQDPATSLNPVYSVGDQLRESVFLHTSLKEEEAEQRMIDALDEVGIYEPGACMEAYPHQLSGGMKQRVMIAMSLLGEPNLLIADEPTTALDVTVQKQVLDLMKRLQKKRGMAILLITHDMGVVSEMADQMVVMYTTRAVEQGKVQDVLTRCAHPYTQGLLHSLPGSVQPGKPLEPIQGIVPPLHALPSGCHFHKRCPYVMDRCRRGKVPLFSLEKKGHLARCWLREDG